MTTTSIGCCQLLGHWRVMTIIHDKMDHAKTVCLCHAHRDKTVDGLFGPHVSVTCTIQDFLFKIRTLFTVGVSDLLLVMLINFNNCLQNVMAIWLKLLALVTNVIVLFNIFKVWSCLDLNV